MPLGAISGGACDSRAVLERQRPSSIQERNETMKLQEALKGMKVKNWEMRLNDKGRRVVYVRFSERPAPITVTVNEEDQEV